MTLEVAIPDTSLTDCPDLRQKTMKIGQLARAFSVFKVENVIIYKTTSEGKMQRDSVLLERMLRYMDTPQYLRRGAFSMSPSLKYAGTLPPLRTRSHPIETKVSSVLDGEVRWGLQASPGKVDIGLDQLIDYEPSLSTRDPTLFRLKRVNGTLQLEKTERPSLDFYFGFDVKVVEDITEYLRNQASKTRIALSRQGPPYASIEFDIKSVVENTRNLIAIFGGPKHGIRELVGAKKTQLKSVIDFWTNTVNDQGTETVRIEEAMWISLSLFNNSFGSTITKPGFYVFKK
ncbi:MAG: putative RNA uridine N3 methyltransferase [Candidatus Thorarchaeota archaeon]